MDWSTSDYTQTYADTFYVPEEDHDAGVYILDEVPQPPARQPDVGVPWRGRGRQRVKEGYYTGGNIISDNKNRESVFDTTWDERPERYNPNSGAEWARLVPNPRDRPYGGGPAPSRAFPMITQSEAMNKPDSLVFPDAPSRACSREGFTPAGALAGLASAGAVEAVIRIITLVLLVIVAVLLAMSLASAGRIERALDKTACDLARLTSLRAPPS